MLRYRLFAVALCIFGLVAPLNSALATIIPTGGAIKVATKPLTPFVMIDDDGRPFGFSVDLWSEIAKINGWETTWVIRETVDQVLDETKSGRVDAGIAGISMTSKREQLVDFSYPMFSSGLQVMIGPSAGKTWQDTITDLLPLFLTIVAAVAGLAFVAGHLIWLFNRKEPEWPPGYVRGVGHGMWLAASTLLANDPGSPRRLVGRLISLLWVLVGILFVATFTANLSSDRTVASIEGTINSVDDLAGKRVATVANTTAALQLDALNIGYRSVAKIDDAYPLLWAGQIDAIVFDAPVLLHHALTVGRGREQLVGAIFKHEPYGIALPTGSENREKINDALLTLQANGVYDRLYRQYFGDTAG